MIIKHGLKKISLIILITVNLTCVKQVNKQHKYSCMNQCLIKMVKCKDLKFRDIVKFCKQYCDK